jgi:glutaredoxin
MTLNITLYTTHCPKCEILQEKLHEKNIKYDICTDKKLMISKGFLSAPMLEVDNKAMTFLEATNWIKEQN